MSAFPTPPETFPPFWYGTYSGLWIYYQVDWKLAQATLGRFTETGSGPGFTAFPFWDKGYQNGNEPFALVCLNFMSYGAQSGSNDPRAYEQILDPLTYPLDPDKNAPPGFGLEPASETELSIVAFPTARAKQAPGKDFTAQAFLAGNDHTKTLGPFRLFVPCDDRIAVFWGTLNFGENKFMTRPFIYAIPSPNNLTNTASMQLATGWSFVIPGAIEEPNYSYDPNAHTCSPFILQASIDCTGIEALLGNPSEILDYSMWTDKGGAKRPIGSRRNMFGTFSTWLFAQQKPKYSYTLGNSKHPMLQTLGELLGSAPTPYAAQVFQTQPVISESGTYYVDI